MEQEKKVCFNCANWDSKSGVCEELSGILPIFEALGFDGYVECRPRKDATCKLFEPSEDFLFEEQAGRDWEKTMKDNMPPLLLRASQF